MKHIELAVSVLRAEISSLERQLKHGHNTPEQEEEIMGKLQKLNRAVNDINAHFIYS